MHWTKINDYLFIPSQTSAFMQNQFRYLICIYWICQPSNFQHLIKSLLNFFPLWLKKKKTSRIIDPFPQLLAFTFTKINLFKYFCTCCEVCRKYHTIFIHHGAYIIINSTYKFLGFTKNWPPKLTMPKYLLLNFK